MKLISIFGQTMQKLILTFVILVSIFLETVAAQDNPTYVLAEYNHDPNSFCQGLVYHSDGFLYEGTGIWGSSKLRKVELESGNMVKEVSLDGKYFGEGITIWNNLIYQLTWQSGVGLIYNLDNFHEVGDVDQFTIDEERTTRNEGWGITNTADKLIVTDGSSYLHFWDPDTFALIEKIQVLDSISNPSGEPIPVSALNEVEYLPSTNEVLANIWQDTRIVVINADTGEVKRYINLQKLKFLNRDGDVLNCITTKPSETSPGDLDLVVTGKFWSSLYITNHLHRDSNQTFTSPVDNGTMTSRDTSSVVGIYLLYSFMTLTIALVRIVK